MFVYCAVPHLSDCTSFFFHIFKCDDVFSFWYGACTLFLHSFDVCPSLLDVLKCFDPKLMMMMP